MSNKIIVNCTTCNKELERLPYQVKASKTGNFFCDKKCRSNWDSIKFENMKLETECECCGKKIRKQASKLKNTKFCSQECLAKNKTREATVVISCDYCNKEFTRTKCQIKNSNLCSVECRSKWNSEIKSRKIELECVICNSKFKVVNLRKDTAKTCSKECSNELKSIEAYENEDIRNRLIANGIKSCLNNKKCDTLPERMVKDELIKYNITYEHQKKMHDKFIVDFFIPQTNTVIEVNGDYWHGNPLIYGEGKKTITEWQIKQQKKDKARKSYLEKCGYNFIVLWENDIYNNLEEIIKPIINQNP